MIRDRGYFHWDGTFIDRRLPWWPVTRQSLRLTFKKKFFKFFFVSSLVPGFVFLAGVYISERMEDFKFMIQGKGALLQVNPAFFKTYYTADFLLLMMILLMLFSGAGLIADDMKHNALQLYFSRPLRKRDYLLGKAGALGFFLLSLTLVPGLLFIIFKLIFSGSFAFLRAYPWLPLSVAGVSLLFTVFFTMYTLLLSSLSPNRRYVSILIFGVYIFSDILFGIFFGLFRSPYFALISIKVNLQQLTAFLFRRPPAFAVPWVYSLLILLAVCLAAFFVLKKRAKGVTVIR
jgi:ABC-type transport system involved in multi-copper enzyme maturation permease subunit